MIPLLLLAFGAPPATASVLVLSKYHPQEVRFFGDCRDQRDKRVRKLVRDGLLVGGPGREARRHVSVSCAKAATLEVAGAKRRFERRFRISVQNKELRITAIVDFESYVAGVVAAELPQGAAAAQGAQAIVARTYALRAIAEPRHSDAPLCDLTHCQVYAGPAPTAGAAEATRGQYLSLPNKKQPAEVYFHSTCGGRTLPADQVWPGASPSLVGVLDHGPAKAAYCEASPHSYWVSEIAVQDAQPVLSKLAGRRLDEASLEFGAPKNGSVAIRDRSGETSVNLVRLQRAMGQALGWNKVKSTRFTAMRTSDVFVLRGHGLGHRVGLCQYGAMARAAQGQSAAQILEGYFPRLKVVP